MQMILPSHGDTFGVCRGNKPVVFDHRYEWIATLMPIC